MNTQAIKNLSDRVAVERLLRDGSGGGMSAALCKESIPVSTFNLYKQDVGHLYVGGGKG